MSDTQKLLNKSQLLLSLKFASLIILLEHIQQSYSSLRIFRSQQCPQFQIPILFMPTVHFHDAPTSRGFFFFFWLTVWHVESSSPTRDQTHAPPQWKCRVLITGQPGKSLYFIIFYFLMCHTTCGILVPQPKIKPTPPCIESMES